MQPRTSLNAYFQDAIRDNWERLAMTDYNGASFHFKDVARKVAKLHLLFENSGIKKGDKIAICGKNSAQWGVAFIAALTYGAVAVPILHEFKADNIHHLVNHSEAKLLFIEEQIWENLDPELMPDLLGLMRIRDYALLYSRSEELSRARGHLNELFGRRYPERFTPADVEFHRDEPEELALINYTSGSTGFSKGVMLPYRSLWSNLQYCIDKITYLEPGDSIVAMLPMAHMYGMSIDIIHAFAKGCHIVFLTRVPSPRIILEAFEAVKPKIIVAVPLIIEKIVKGKVFPMLEKPLMRILRHVPMIDDRLMTRIKDRLTAAFGGNVQEIIIGGAALNREVEVFLNKIGFPFTAGYGMTECGPLITYSPWYDRRVGTCGRVVDRMEIKISSPNPVEVPGVLWTRGCNMMLGYYKNEEATAECMDDGWMSTGDICTMDHDGFVYIRGRNKNMILGASGQNIYPEEIEDKLNNMPYVNESLVIEEDGRLVALIYPDIDNVTAQGIAESQIEPLMNENIEALNRELPSYSKISRMRLMNEEFEKTPKRSIKRYLYQHS